MIYVNQSAKNVLQLVFMIPITTTTELQPWSESEWFDDCSLRTKLHSQFSTPFLKQIADHENKSTNAANKAIAEKNRIKRMKGITTTIATAILIWTRMVWWLFNQDKVIGQSKQRRGSGQTVFNRSMVFIFVIVVTSDIMCTNTVKCLRTLKCNHFLQGLFLLHCKMNRTSLVSWRH